MRTCWANAIASASNVQGRLETLEVWMARTCKSKHPLINAMLQRYRFLNRNLNFYDFDVVQTPLNIIDKRLPNQDKSFSLFLIPSTHFYKYFMDIGN